MRVSRITNCLIVLLFAASIWVPMVSMSLGIGMVEETGEKRALAAAPDFRCDPIDEIPKKADDYFRDHFAFRQILIRCNSIVKHVFLRVSTASVVVGEDGWLYYAKAGLIEDFTGQSLFTAEQLASWKSVLENHRDLCEKRGTPYLFVLAPDKATVYPEYLPRHLRNRKGETRREQLVAYLRNSTNVDVFDLTEEIRSHKNSGPLYYREDTHWNGRGRFIAYRAIVRRLDGRIGGLEAPAIGTSWRIDLDRQYGYGDLRGMLGLQYPDLVPLEFMIPVGDQRVQPVEVTLPGEVSWPEWSIFNKPLSFKNPYASRRLMVTWDSFSRAGVKDRAQPLASHFGESVFICHYPTTKDLQTLLDWYRPDVVIEARVERSLAYLPH